MAATLTLEREKEIAERTRRDPKVIMSFYEWYERYRRQEQNDATACELALRRQQEVYEAMYQHKRAEHMALLRQNYRDQVLQRKRQRTGPGFWTKNGLQVRSKIEKIIADFLCEKGLRLFARLLPRNRRLSKCLRASCAKPGWSSDCGRAVPRLPGDLIWVCERAAPRRRQAPVLGACPGSMRSSGPPSLPAQGEDVPTETP